METAAAPTAVVTAAAVAAGTDAMSMRGLRAGLMLAVFTVFSGVSAPVAGQEKPAAPLGQPTTPQPRFPERAMQRGITDGRVTLECEVLADGSFTACRVLSEDHAGAGFGQEALAAGRHGRLAASDLDPSVAGAKIRFVVRFSTR